MKRQQKGKWRATVACLFALVAMGLWLGLAPEALAKPGDKVTICHVPPGDPANAHELVVAPSAVQAHLKNHPGDAIGPCAPPPECTSSAQCEDNNPCTVNTCTPAGTCDYSQPVVCDDGNPCTGDVCMVEQGGCVYPPASGAACDDGDACTGTDVCTTGVCAGAAIPGCCNVAADCNDSDACTTDACFNHACGHAAVTCPDPVETCYTKVCDSATGCGTAPVTCTPDGNICTADTCDTLTGDCTYPPVETPPEPGTEVTCNDGLDNDCDGSVDAADTDCGPVTCPCDSLLPQWAQFIAAGDFLWCEDLFSETADWTIRLYNSGSAFIFVTHNDAWGNSCGALGGFPPPEISGISYAEALACRSRMIEASGELCSSVG